MRLVTLVLIALIAALQYPLWFGKGSWAQVHETAARVDARREINHQFDARNRALDAEVIDLKQGSDAIEERARRDLGMIKRGEIFFQISRDGDTHGSRANGQQ